MALAKIGCIIVAMKDFLKKLVQQNTTNQNGELEAVKIIAEQFAKSGIKSTIDLWDNTRANIIAHIKSNSQTPALLFLCHLDVVPPGDQTWSKPPFSAIEQNGKIHGRGSADMKGGIAAIVTAIRQLVDEKTEFTGDIIFAATAGEETDSCGVKRFLQNSTDLPNLAGCVIPEPTDFEIVISHKGLLWLEIETKGKTAHGSTPHLGVNAIGSMRTFLEKIESEQKARFSDKYTMSINRIHSGKAVNVVPDKCSAAIDIRSNIGVKHSEIIHQFEEILTSLKQENKNFDATIKTLRNVGPLKTNENNPFVKEFCNCLRVSRTKSINYCTDGAFVAELNLPIVIFGPGNPQLCHNPNEYIEIADVEKAVQHYKKIILKFLTQTP